MAQVMELINEIKTELNKPQVDKNGESKLKNKTSSKTDEVKVMTAMMNDPFYEVDVYDHSGLKGTYAPGKDFRNMVSTVLANTAKITKDEAAGLVENYEFTKSQASTMVDFSKEFLNTYLETGRTVSLGGREKSNIAFKQKLIEGQYRTYPKEVSPGQYERCKTYVPEHVGVSTSNKCPSWLKK